jgi:hypothetical protein
VTDPDRPGEAARGRGYFQQKVGLDGVGSGNRLETFLYCDVATLRWHHLCEVF